MKKTMKLWLSVVAVMLAVSAVFAACTSPDEGEKNNEDDFLKPAGTYRVGTDIDAGEYLLITDGQSDAVLDMGTYSVTTAPNALPASDDFLYNGMFYYRKYIRVSNGEYLQFAWCKLYEIDEVSPVDKNADSWHSGQYKVGDDIDAGTYKLTALASDSILDTGSYTLTRTPDADILSDDFIGNGLIEGQTYVELETGTYLEFKKATLTKESSAEPPEPPEPDEFYGYSEENFNFIAGSLTGLLEDLQAGFFAGQPYNGEVPQWFTDAAAGAVDTVFTSMQAAGIADADLTEILAFAEQVGEVIMNAPSPVIDEKTLEIPEYDPDIWDSVEAYAHEIHGRITEFLEENGYSTLEEYENAMFQLRDEIQAEYEEYMADLLELFEAAADLSVSNTKISKFVYSLVAAVGPIIEDAAEDDTLIGLAAAADIDIAGYAELYGKVLELGEEKLVSALNAVLNLGKGYVGMLPAVMELSEDAEAFLAEMSKDTFRDFYAGLRDEVKSILTETLDAETLEGLVALAEIFSPLFDDENGSIMAQIEAGAQMFAAVSTSAVAALNVMDDSMINAFYDAIESENQNAVVVIIGKIANAALNVQNGLTGESAWAVFQMIPASMQAGGAGGDSDIPQADEHEHEAEEELTEQQLFIQMFEMVKVDSAWIAALEYTHKFTPAEIEQHPLVALIFEMLNADTGEHQHSDDEAA